MQYLLLVLIIFVALGVVLISLPYMSMLIVDLNNINAKVYTTYSNETYLSGTWLVNGSKFTQVSTTPSNALIIRVAQGSYMYISNSSWSEMLSDNGDNGPIYSPYAQFNLSAGYYKVFVPNSSVVDFEQPTFSALDIMAPFVAILFIFTLFMVLAYSKRR